MTETNQLTCFSLTCSFACQNQTELEKHEQEHKKDLEKLRQETNDEEEDLKEDDCN